MLPKASIFKHLTTGLFLLALIISFKSVEAQTRQTMYVEGRNIYTACGEQVVLRGVNEMFIWSGNRTGSTILPQIAQTGANSVRLVWTTTGSTTELRQLIENCIANKMIAVPELHDATGDFSKFQLLLDYWKQPVVVQLMNDNKEWVILNIGNEVGGGSESNAQYQAYYQDAITQLRNAGYEMPFMIDAGGWGNNEGYITSTAAALMNHDPLKNLIFSVHTYWMGTQAQNQTRLDALISNMKSQNLPLVFGEAPQYAASPSSCSTVFPYQYFLRRCQEEGLGWQAWSWGAVDNGDCGAPNSVFDITSNGNFGSWATTFGQEICVSDANSIQKTSVRPQSLLDGTCVSTSTDCNGDANGTAITDECGVCVNGATGKTTCVTTLQAGNYLIKPLHSSLCLQTGTTITQENCGSSISQVWKMSLSDKDYIIQNPETGQYLTYGAGTSGTYLSMSSTAANHLWRLEAGGSGSYNLVAKSNTNAVVDIMGNSTLPGAAAILYTRTSENNQKFIFEAVSIDCNNDINGTATTDNCGRCIGGNTEKTACISLSELEDACSFDGATETTNAGFTGASYVNLPNAIGTQIRFAINSSINQTTDLYIRYCNGSLTDRNARVLLNNTEVISSAPFTPTGSWTSWSNQYIQLNLATGNNYITIESLTDAGGANYDAVLAGTSGLSEGNCTVTSLNNSQMQGIEVFPNPFTNTFSIKLSGDFQYAVYNTTGQEVESGSAVNQTSAGQHLGSGVYMVKVSTSEETYFIKVAK